MTDIFFSQTLLCFFITVARFKTYFINLFCNFFQLWEQWNWYKQDSVSEQLLKSLTYTKCYLFNPTLHSACCCKLYLLMFFKICCSGYSKHAIIIASQFLRVTTLKNSSCVFLSYKNVYQTVVSWWW